jgi:hypothetical protein
MECMAFIRPLLCWCVVLAGCAAHVDRAARPTTERAGAAGAGAFRQVVIGICEDYPPESMDLEVVRRDLRAMKALGIRDMRVSFGWDDLEPERGQYKWDAADALVRVAVDEFGMRLTPYVCYTPKWNVTAKGEGGWKSPPEDVGAFGEVMRRLAERYRGKIDSWEIWNEPDNVDYWQGTAEQYAELLRAGSDGVRRGNAGAKVVFGGIAWETDFVREVFAEHEGAKYVDVVNAHAYFETWSPEGTERLPDYVARLKQIVREYGEDEPIWLNEVGYSNHRVGGRVSPVYRATWAYEHTAEFQAVALVRTVATAVATEAVDLIGWYELKDLTPGADVIGDKNNYHLGVLTPEGRPKPAAEALAFCRRLFAEQPVRCMDREVIVSRRIDSDTHVHCFERRDGSVVVVAWLGTTGSRRVPVDEEGDVEDRRVETISLALPVGVEMAERYVERGRRVWPSETAGGESTGWRCRAGTSWCWC